MRLLKFGAVFLVLTALWGCGKGNGSAAPTIDTVTGKHAAGWVDIGAGGLHPASYFDKRESCSECHGKDLNGGISKVSCSPGDNNIGCHPRFPHAGGFSDPSAHGKYATGVFTGIGIMGIAHCKNCHGYDFRGGPAATSWAGPSCIKCHQERGANPSTNAPHGANWKAYVGRHSKTHSSNVPACFQCHANGQYSHAPPKPAPPGTEPGCFNGTLCHNDPLAHKIPFIAPADHGNAIKNTYDWAYCANCHAALGSNDLPRYNVSKGVMTNGCESCHNKPYMAHPQMWLPGRGSGTPTSIGGVDAVKNTSHTDVPPAQIITSCTICHGIAGPSPNSVVPSCATAGGKSIDGIRCHFTSPVNSQGQTVGCSSCHSFSAASEATFSATYPTRDYKHSAHIPSINRLWPGLTPACYSCHVSLGNGATHADGTGSVAILGQFGGTYNTSSFTCSSVSCHRGKQTPAWTATGSVGCVACHENSNGSPNSGAHNKHLNGTNVVMSCPSCHFGGGYGSPEHGRGTVILGISPTYGSLAKVNADYTCSNVSCHLNKPKTPVWSAQNVGCIGCHDNSDGSQNSGAHQKHKSSGVTSCSACHNGGGYGTAQHGYGVLTLSILPTYGTSAAYNSDKTCSNVTCHNGKKTPSWYANSTGCLACHDNADGSPNSPAHPKHKSAGITACNTCHNGAGYGTPLHENGKVDVSILPTYGASAVLNSDKTCSNVTCHGGKQTPVWTSTNSGCVACHVNADGSPNSGRHQKHVNGVELKLPCASCHYGAGSGTPLHANGTVNIDVSPLFDENGAATFNTTVPGKCTNLSCHAYGARPTALGTSAFPVWTDPNTTLFNPKCAVTCHKVSTVAQPADTTTIPVPYYNGPFSGTNDNPDTGGGDVTLRPFGPGVGFNLHQIHNSFGQCTDCHVITGRHFAKLNQGLGRRRILPGEAADTLKGPSITSYVPATSSCVATCHPTRAQLWYK